MVNTHNKAGLSVAGGDKWFEKSQISQDPLLF